MKKIVIILVALMAAACSSTPDKPATPQYGVLPQGNVQVVQQPICFQYEVPFDGSVIRGQICNQ